ncbi:Protein of unknown function DUF3102 [Nostoc flagelliforme CCNUN1]|uniref:DUF3102 domain-containing protein n=1 Tax=Nostoc flagelliforme CCNUN1 TaxID=2038116 RepID=A0A2K8SJ40_9NOSO|nr:DUF3102 domain-containing protein [Nostoc flagelliforme]AUB35496.1 Protein of unknown function DUF3102 [Nostoc flagelliforme CCNUN1]
MKISNDESIASPIEVKVITTTQREDVVDQPLVPKSKSEFKTNEEKQQRLTSLAEDTRRRLKRSATDIYYIGLNLLEAQNIIEHGQFLPWLQQEFGMGKTSAYEFINVAKAFESKFPIIGNLINNITPTALCKLAAPSTSQAARDEAMDIVKAGKLIDPDVAKKLISKHKTPKIAKKQQQKISSSSQQNDINKVEALTLPKIEVNQMEQMANNSIALSFTSQQGELEELKAERDIYKTQLEELKIANEQLQLDIVKLRYELKLLQNINNT